MTPRIFGRSYAIEANVHVPESGAEGVLVANADFIGGFALWVNEEGRLCHTYSLLGVDTYRQVSDEPIPTGDVTLKMLFEADETKPGTPAASRSGPVTARSARARLEHTVPVAFTSYSGMDIGRDNGGVVDLEYEDKAPYAFTGTIKEVIFDLTPAGLEDETALHHHAAVHAVAAGAAG